MDNLGGHFMTINSDIRNVFVDVKKHKDSTKKEP